MRKCKTVTKGAGVVTCAKLLNDGGPAKVGTRSSRKQGEPVKLSHSMRMRKGRVASRSLRAGSHETVFTVKVLRISRDTISTNFVKYARS